MDVPAPGSRAYLRNSIVGYKQVLLSTSTKLLGTFTIHLSRRNHLKVKVTFRILEKYM